MYIYTYVFIHTYIYTYIYIHIYLHTLSLYTHIHAHTNWPRPSPTIACANKRPPPQHAATHCNTLRITACEKQPPLKCAMQEETKRCNG